MCKHPPAEAQELIELLGLEKHPEGGWYCQTFKDQEMVAERANSTAIYYLLQKGERSHWHRVDAVEIWHYYGGAPLRLSISADGKSKTQIILGNDFAAGQFPQVIVKKREWQSAVSLGNWTLCGCTVAPGFEFEGFELAEDGWEPLTPEE
ncbi:MAG: cupin domain-containing protein [Devosiaceae bacterium]|nr:cupin domain-containing protein [Devosiaceae bacterium]